MQDLFVLLKKDVFLLGKDTSIIYMKNVHTCLLCLESNVEADYYLEKSETVLNGLFSRIRWERIVPTRVENAVLENLDYLNHSAFV